MFRMRRFLEELGLQQEKYVLNCDTQSAIDLAQNPAFHYKTKHSDVRYHWIRQVLDDAILQLDKIHTKDNPTSMLTKIFPKDKQELCRTLVDMIQT